MENIFNCDWNSPNTWPIINANGDIIGSMAPGEETYNYLPVMVDKITKQLYRDMTQNPTAYIAEDDYKE